MKTLISLSGGWDSAYLLYRILADTNDDVTAFFLDMSAIDYNHPKWHQGYYQRLSDAESIASSRVAAWLNANVRPMAYQSIKVDTILSGEWVNPVAIRTGAAMVKDYDRFLYGACPEFGRTGLRLQWYRDLWDQIAPVGKPMEWPLRDWNQCRPHAMKLLPHALQALIYSCVPESSIQPSVTNGDPVICGKCHKCLANANLTALMNNGADPDMALDYLRRLRGVDEHRGSLVVDERYYHPLAGYLTGTGGV